MAKDERITLWLKGCMIEVDEFFIRNGKRYMSGYCRKRCRSSQGKDSIHIKGNGVKRIGGGGGLVYPLDRYRVSKPKRAF